MRGRTPIRDADLSDTRTDPGDAERRYVRQVTVAVSWVMVSQATLDTRWVGAHGSRIVASHYAIGGSGCERFLTTDELYTYRRSGRPGCCGGALSAVVVEADDDIAPHLCLSHVILLRIPLGPRGVKNRGF
jgi:hypothetical protein